MLGAFLLGEMESYLPQPGDLKEWEPSGEPQYVKGDDLFLLIDGGAEVYHEYGFKQAIAQGFKMKNGRPGNGFNLEIYEMLDPEAAYGIYTFKIAGKGQPLDVGDAGLLEDYYLNAWKGNFLVTVTGFDAGKDTLTGIVEAAKVVMSKIKSTGPASQPPLVHLLPSEYQDRMKLKFIKYLKGNLALFNQYEFDSRNIFGLRQGVMGDYGIARLFVFKYENAAESLKWFENGKKELRQNPRFKYVELQGSTVGLTFSLVDGKGRLSYIKNNGPYIFIVQGNETDAKQINEFLFYSISKSK
ncbi:MAG: hypothetical protein QG657_2552 [Acidobacteriota bacterium]|nr:hypothetical protein [Acidobacteriota bacterium]